MDIDNLVKLYSPSEKDPYWKIKFKANGEWVLRERKNKDDAIKFSEEVTKAIRQCESRLACLSSAEKERLNAALV